MGKLYVGASKVCISPTQDMLDKLAAAGATAFKGVHKDVFVRCIALTDGTQKFLIFSIEMGSFPAQRRFRETLCNEFGIHPNAVMLGNTHNHQMLQANDPEENPPGVSLKAKSEQEIQMNEWLISFFHGKALDAAAEALHSAVPARMGYTSGTSYINASRDWQTPIGGMQNADYGGYSDRELPIVKFVSEDGKPIASLVNFGVHSNMLFGFRFDGQFPYISGDLGGEIMDFVENAHAQKEICLWVEAAAGDQNPLFTSFMPGVKPDQNGVFQRVQMKPDANTVIMLMEHLAQVQGLEILKAETSILTYSDDFDVKYGRSVRTIPGIVNARTKLNLMFSRGQEDSGRTKIEVMPEEFRVMERTSMGPIAFQFHLAVINGLALCGVNTEPYSYLGRIIKDVLPYQKTMVFAIDAGHTGYMADVRKGEIAGFGTLDCHAESLWDVEKAFYEGFRDLASDLEKGKRGCSIGE